MLCDVCPIKCSKIRICGFNINSDLPTIANFRIIDDNIERFDFYHYKPGSRVTMIILSGCNQLCVFCPEYKIVMKRPNSKEINQFNELISALAESNNTIFGFYCNSTVHIHTIKKLRSLFPDKEFIVLSNGLINEKYFDEYISALSAINIIFLGYSPLSYAKLSVYPYTYKFAFKLLSYAYSRIHTEVTFIVTPGIIRKDEFKLFLEDLLSISSDIPLHLKRFYPNFAELNRRPTRTKELMEYYNLATNYLNYVYAEVWGVRPNNTYCPNGHLIIQRFGWKVIKKYIKEDKCPFCGVHVPIVP